MIRQIGDRFRRFQQRHRHDEAAIQMRDWPNALKLNDAAIWLAPHIYGAEQTAYSQRFMPFAELQPHMKRNYIWIAESAIKHAKAECHGD